LIVTILRHVPTSRRRLVAAAALFSALFSLGVGAKAQDAASTNVKFDLVTLDGGGEVSVSATRVAVLAVEPIAGSMSSATLNATLGVLSGATIDAFSGPQIVDVSPSFGDCSGGEIVRIRGLNFNQGGLGAAVTVKIGAAPPVTPNSVGPNEIYLTTPPGAAGSADVIVTTPFGSITLASAYDYVCPGGAPVAVFSISPAIGDADGDTLVTLTGLSFLPGSAVLFDGLSASNVVIVNETTLQCRTPAHPAGFATPVVVNSQGAGSLPFGFEYKAWAKVTNLGGGCPGTNGQPQCFVGGALPIVGGAPFQFVLANALSNSPSLLILGTEYVGGWVIDGTSCVAMIYPFDYLYFPATSSGFGTAVLTFELPPIPALVGFNIAAQWIVTDENGALGLFSMSNGLRVRLGIAP
jgi:hypothetical protein